MERAFNAEEGNKGTQATTVNPVPFMLYSGNIADELQRQAYQAGAMAVLSKPYRLSDFMVIVTQTLETP